MKKLFFVSLLSVATYSLEAVMATGDTPDGATTFQFSIGSAIYNSETQSTWTASGVSLTAYDDEIKKYGLSYTPFIPVDNSNAAATLTAYPNLTTSATVTQLIGDTLDLHPEITANPLFGKAFSSLTLVGSSPTLVVTDEPKSIYYMQKVTFGDNARGLNSAVGSSIINRMDYADDQQVHSIAGIGNSNLFAARATGAFGSTASHLSFVQLVSIAAIQGTIQSTFLCLKEQASETISTTTPVLIAGTIALTSIGSSISMYPSGKLNTMYVGLDVRVPNTSGACGVGLFTATGVNSSGDTSGSLTYNSIIPDAVVTAGMATPVSASRNERVAVRNIATGSTSTGLGYLFVSRDNGAGGAQSIYAMPMLTMPSTSSNFGKIAAFDSVETVFKISGVSYRTQGFSQVIADANEINIAGTEAVVNRLLVGAGAVPIVAGQYIDELIVQGDAVYITIQEAFATGTTPGMFKSDAIFDASGRIMSWTSWQRVAGTDDQMLFSIKNRQTGATMYVSGSDSKSVEQTTWNNNGDMEAFISKVTSYLPKKNGGAQGCIPFPTSTSGFTSLPDSQVSLVAATGNGNVIIAQTGQLNVATQTLRILPQTADTSIVIDSSIGLDIGSVVTAAFGTDGEGNNWLFMGGDGGLSVLSHTDGSGFETLPNDGAADFLIHGDGGNQTCKTLGSFTFVKKIVFDGDYLYVMTQNALFRILMDQAKFTTTSPMALGVELVVSASQLAPFAYCLDMLVDIDMILLGTTSGLYSINVHTGLPGVVTSIPIPLGLPAITSLQAVSFTKDLGMGQFDYGFYSSSNLYVLSIDFVTEQARLNRFTITDGVATPIQDQLLPGQNGPLVVFDYMSNNLFIDGSLGFATSYRIRNQVPTVKYLEYTLQAGISGRHFGLAASTNNISIGYVINSLGITGIVRDFSSGSLVMAADFGLLADS